MLVIVTRQIGDVLLTTPLIRAARRRWPDARIEVLGFAGTLGMLQGNPDIDATVEVPARPGWRGAWALLRGQWQRHDLALVAEGSDRAHLIGWLAARERSGLLPAQGSSNWWKRRLLRHAVAQSGDRGEVHVVAEKLALLAPWAPDAPAPRVVPPPAAPLPPELEARLRDDAVIVHAPSMWRYKQWPVEHFRVLVSQLVQAGHQVLLTGAKGDRELTRGLADLAPAPALIDLAGQLDFAQLAGLMARVRLYVGPDTSVSHLAAAVGVPVITLFGPTNPMRWGPWPAADAGRAPYQRVARVQQAGNVTLVQGTPACVPCGRAGCEDHRDSRADCLQSIAPETVVQLVRDRLDPRTQDNVR